VCLFDVLRCTHGGSCSLLDTAKMAMNTPDAVVYDMLALQNGINFLPQHQQVPRKQSWRSQFVVLSECANRSLESSPLSKNLLLQRT